MNHISQMSAVSAGSRTERAKELWEEVLQTGYLNPELKSWQQLEPLFERIRSFLLEEEIEFHERNSLVITLNLLEQLQPASQDDFQVMIHRFTRTAKDLDKQSEGYSLGTGPYSSVYAALLAIVLDDATLRRCFDYLKPFLNAFIFVDLYKLPVVVGDKPLIAFYRGQRSDWSPIPKTGRLPRGWKALPRTAAFLFRERVAMWKAILRFYRQMPQLVKLSSIQLQGVFQHYGFVTALLDFSTNLEVAAFFATACPNPAEVGVIYRLHPLAVICTMAEGILWAQTDSHPLVSNLSRANQERSFKAAKKVEVSKIQGILRMERQEAVFIKGLNLGPVRAFLEPVRFRQVDDVRYERPSRNITRDWLLPADDPVKALLEPVLDEMGRKTE